MPVYNEQTQISKVVKTMPDFVDAIIIVDDKSTDDTVIVVKELKTECEKIVLIQHENNLVVVVH